MGNPDFRDLPESDLQRLSDDELIEYIRRARDAGRPGSMKLALSILVFGYMDTVRARVRLKVPQADVDDVAASALVSAISSAFSGQSTGEFRSWMHTIVSRRIADYHRKREGQPDLVALPTEHEGDDEFWGEEPSSESAGEAIDLQRTIDDVYDELKVDHQQVIDLYVFGDQAAGDTAAQVSGMTEANVHQIASRFRKRIREILEGGDNSP